MIRNILIILILIMASSAVYAEPTVNLNDESLITVLSALKTGSRAYFANEAYNEGGRLQHDAAISQFYPQLDGTLDSTGQNSFTTRTSAGSEVNNNYSLSIGPELSFTQKLPSNGTLSGSISDSISAAGIEQSNSILIPQNDPVFQNNLTLSIGVTQPLYFGDAYGASKSRVENSFEISGINYLNNRNILVISAIEDYYNLLTAKYQVELISVRLETNTENLRRMEKEYQLGMWTASHLNSSKAASLQAEADLLKARQTFISAAELFSAVYELSSEQLPVLGNTAEIDISTAITVFQTEDFEINQLLSHLSANNPDLRISLSQIESAESEIILEESKSAMLFNAGGSYKLSNGLTEETFSDNLSLSLSINSSIIDGGAVETTRAIKQNELRRLENKLDDNRKRTISQMKLLLNNIILDRKLSEIYTIQEETGRQEYEKGLREFELGGITQKDLLDLQIDLENTKLTLLLNKINNNLTVLKLYKLLGYDLEGMLMADFQYDMERK
jgi:outer membrane protein TolC